MPDPKKCRDKAARLREEATQTDHRDVRSTMIEVAELHDRLAETLERRRGQQKNSAAQ